jgi:hypothetical protein
MVGNVETLNQAFSQNSQLQTHHGKTHQQQRHNFSQVELTPMGKGTAHK